MVVTEYVRKPWLRDSPFLNCILKFICCGKIAEPIGSSLGQFDLLKATKKQRRIPECIVKLYHTARSFVLLTDDEDFRINKCKTLRPVPADIEEMICSTLAKNRDGLIGGQESLMRRTELEGDERLARHCKAQTHIERIMVWHVATSTLELEEGGGGGGRQLRVGGSNKRLMDLEDGRRTRKGSGSRRVDYRLVATTLCKYCAYLVFYKPKLLPVASNSVRYMCNVLLEEVKAIDGKEADNGGEEAANGKEGPAHDSQEDVGIVSRGRKLAKDLEISGVPAHGGGGDDLWEALAELWCELLVSMAPHGSIGAHQKELGKGGEFITHLWALLYHAGIDDKFSGSSTAAAAVGDDAPPSRDDNYGWNIDSSHC